MRVFTRVITLFFIVFAFSGCAGDYKIKKAADINDAGIKYTTNVQKFLVLEHDLYSKLIVRQLYGQERTEGVFYEKYHYAMMRRDNARENMRFVQHLKTYFLKLGELAKDNSSETAKSVSDIASILKGDMINLKINDAQSGAIPDIVNGISTEYRGHLIEKTFKNDGETIRKAIVVVRNMLIRERKNYKDMLYRSKVVGVYQVNKYINLPQGQAISNDIVEDFVSDTGLATPETAFNDAISASIEMEYAWVDAISGRISTNDFFLSLDRFSSTIYSLTQLRN